MRIYTRIAPENAERRHLAIQGIEAGPVRARRKHEEVPKAVLSARLVI